MVEPSVTSIAVSGLSFFLLAVAMAAAVEMDASVMTAAALSGLLFFFPAVAAVADYLTNHKHIRTDNSLSQISTRGQNLCPLIHIKILYSSFILNCINSFAKSFNPSTITPTSFVVLFVSILVSSVILE